MKDFISAVLLIIGVIIGIILLLAIIFGIGGLIWWGIGYFVVWAFGINFTWTFWHGLAVELVTTLLKGLLKITIKKEN